MFAFKMARTKKQKKIIRRGKIAFFVLFIVSLVLLISNGIIPFIDIFGISLNTETVSWILAGLTMGAVFWWGLLWTLEKIEEE